MSFENDGKYKPSWKNNMFHRPKLNKSGGGLDCTNRNLAGENPNGPFPPGVCMSVKAILNVGERQECQLRCIMLCGQFFRNCLFQQQIPPRIPRVPRRLPLVIELQHSGMVVCPAQLPRNQDTVQDTERNRNDDS